MKRFIYILLLVMAFPQIADAQWGVGMRSSKFVYESYSFGSGFEVRFEQSILAEKASSQHLRAYFGWHGNSPSIDYGADAYAGLGLNGKYFTTGILGYGRYDICRFLGIYGALNPHYDSGYDLRLCFRAGVRVPVAQEISILADYNTIPVYRLDERRIRFGASFLVSSLWLCPMLTMPTEGGQKYKSMRVEVSFLYTFNTHKNSRNNAPYISEREI